MTPIDPWLADRYAGVEHSDGPYKLRDTSKFFARFRRRDGRADDVEITRIHQMPQGLPAYPVRAVDSVSSRRRKRVHSDVWARYTLVFFVGFYVAIRLVQFV